MTARLAKQIAMRARSFKADMTAIFQERVDQNPIRLKMSVTTAKKVTAQLVVFVLRRQRFAVDQQIKDRF